MFVDEAELRRIAELCVKYNKPLTVHSRAAHLIIVGRGNFGDKNEALSIINRMCEEGVQAQFDIYNEKKGVSVITVVLPAWYRGMTDAQRQKP